MNIKEKILKIGKRKNCFIAFLIAILIAFAVLGGLNGSNSGNIKANALEEPTSKNLDLNGIRYTYQTSLSELKNKYGFFTKKNNRRFCQIHEDNEGYNNVIFGAIPAPIDTNEKLKNANLVLESVIKFYDINNNIIEPEYLNNIIDETSGAYNKSTSFGPTLKFSMIKRIDFNIATLLNQDFAQEPYKVLSSNFTNNFNNPYIIKFIYSDDTSIDNNDMVVKAYAFAKPIDYKFYIDTIEGFKLRLITIDFNSTISQQENVIETSVQESDWLTASEESYVRDGYITIDNIQFINNDNANIIKFDADTTQIHEDGGNSNELPVYKGNLLLSKDKYDFEFINDVANSNSYGVVPIYGKAIFGGNFKNNKQYTINLGFVVGRDSYSLDAWSKTVYVGNKLPGPGFGNITYISNELYGSSTQSYTVIYNNQSRLLYLTNNNSLKGMYSGTTYEGLSTQVEDVLYNVNYVGDIEEEEFNKKVQEDFENLLKTVGLGAFIGLLIGLFFGNPLLGAAIGAMWGLIAGIFPLLIDGLQAIFGKDFLSGLYNFFKSITEFFANFVDTIINFLISIITNPFVLILILIIAIIFVVRYFQKK